MTEDIVPEKLAEKPLNPMWQVLAIFLALFVIGQNVDGFLARINHNPGRGGILSAIEIRIPCRFDGDCLITAVADDAETRTLGVKVGDILRYDRRTDCCRALRVGEKVGVTLVTSGIPRHVELVAKQMPWTDRQEASLRGRAVFYFGCLIMALIGAFIIIRSRGLRAPLLVGTAFACTSLHGTSPHLWASDPMLYPAVTFLTETIFTLPPLMFLAFARQWRQDTNGRDGVLSRGGVRLYGLIVLISVIDGFSTNVGASLLGDLSPHISRGTTWLGLGLSFALLLTGWWEARREDRGRYILMVVAVSLTMGLQLFGLMINATGNDWRLSNPLLIALVVCSISGPILFAYAILRHRLLDVGFAVNRALIYTGVSVIILLAFGLSEWGVEKILPLLGLQANMLFDAGIALAVFFAFHHIQGFVEKAVEGVFFRKWHNNEAALDRFVTDSGFFHDADALEKAAIKEFERFSDGAAVQFYRRDEAGFGLAEGEGTERIAADQPAVVRLRADLKPVEFELAETLGAALVLPTLYRNEIDGFFLLGAKPSGDAYRPDEVKVLCRAARKIGADLHALRIEELQEQAGTLRRDLDVMTGRYEALRGALPA